MARLYRYSISSDKSGYFLRGWTPNTGNTTLQVTKIAADIFDWLNLQSEDQIPNDLLYAMLETELIYTNSGGNQQEQYSIDPHGISNSLSETQFNRLIGFLKAFDDDAPHSVRQLASALEADSRQVTSQSIPNFGDHPTKSDSSHTKTVELETIVDRIFREEDGLPDIQKSTISTIKKVPGSILLEEVEELPNGESLVQAMASYPGAVRRVSSSDTGLHYTTTLPNPQSPDQFTPIGSCRVSDRSSPNSTEIQVNMVFSLSNPYQPLARSSGNDRVSYIWEVSQGEVTKFNAQVFAEFETTSQEAEQKIKKLESFFLDVVGEFAEYHSSLDRSITSHFDYSQINPLIMDFSTTNIETGYITNILQHQSKFGFIRSSEYGRSIFFHESKVSDDIAKYSIGDWVRFEVLRTEKGLQADNLEHIAPPDAQPSQPRLQIKKGDLVKQDINCIVIPQQGTPKLQSRLGKSARTAGGIMVEKDAAAYQPMTPGSVFVTDGHRLDADLVIHAITSDENSSLDKQGIEDLYKSIFETAKNTDISSIALPPIGTEYCGLSIDGSVRALVDSTWHGMGLSEIHIITRSGEAYSKAVGKEV